MNIAFILGHPILSKKKKWIRPKLSVHYPPFLRTLSLNQALFYLNVLIEKVFKRCFPGVMLEFFGGLCYAMGGILENIPRYTKETNNKQTLVINETDELAKETQIIGILFTMEKILKILIGQRWRKLCENSILKIITRFTKTCETTEGTKANLFNMFEWPATLIGINDDFIINKIPGGVLLQSEETTSKRLGLLNRQYPDQ